MIPDPHIEPYPNWVKQVLWAIAGGIGTAAIPLVWLPLIQSFLGS